MRASILLTQQWSSLTIPDSTNRVIKYMEAVSPEL